MLKYTIKNIEEQDFDQLVKLDKEVNPTSFWGTSDYKRVVDSGLCEMIGAFEGSTLIGYLIFFILKNDFEIIGVATEKNYRNQGIARMLFQCIFARAEERKIDRIFLEVRFSNVYARELYKKLGFEEVGIRKHYYVDPNEDGILYTYYVQKTIPTPFELHKK